MQTVKLNTAMNALKMHKYTGKRRQKGTEANDIMEKKTERILITQTKRYKDKRKECDDNREKCASKRKKCNR